MTLCVGIVCTDKETGLPAIVLASDGQLTQGPIKAKTSKMLTYTGDFETDPYNEEGYKIEFALAGDAYVAEEAFFKILDILQDKIPVSIESPALELLSLKEKIGDIVYEIYSKYLERCEEKPWFELLIGAADEVATLVHINAEGKSHYSNDYAMIGRGVITGGMMILNEFYKPELSIEEAVQLAIMTIKMVGKSDTSVGNDIEISVCTDKSGYEIEDEELDYILNIVDTKWRLVRDVFWAMDDTPNIEKYLKKRMNY